jgi:hypothetical protein
MKASAAKAERHVSPIRRALTGAAKRRLEEIGWSLNERTLNASTYAGNFTVMVYFEKEREGQIGIINPNVRNRRTVRAEVCNMAKRMAMVESTIDQAIDILTDLRRWMTEDHLEAMGIIAQEESR